MAERKSPFLELSDADQRSALEALIFASDEPMTLKLLYSILIEEEQGKTASEPLETQKMQDGEADQSEKGKFPKQKEVFVLFERLIEEINEELAQGFRAFRIVKVAGGFQFSTTAQHGELIARLVKSKSKRRLSQAALETLAIIAYRQPISKPEIEVIRGVSCNEMVNSLMEKSLVTIVGRSEAIGKPLLYGTTPDFLRAFGLHSVADLPKPRELEELLESRSDVLNQTETVLISTTDDVETIEQIIQKAGTTEEKLG